MIPRASHTERLHHDGFHRFRSMLDYAIDCRVQVIEEKWNTVVIVTDLSDSIYSSITLHTEEVVEQICEQFAIDPDRLIFVEHIPERPDLGRDEDLYDIVHFQVEKCGTSTLFSQPTWVPLTPAEFRHLTGQWATPDPSR